MARKTQGSTSRKTARRDVAPKLVTADVVTADTMPEHQRQHMVAEAAYYIAAARGFAPGNELDDWLAAERLIDDHCN
jgi:hypothetical protein